MNDVYNKFIAHICHTIYFFFFFKKTRGISVKKKKNYSSTRNTPSIIKLNKNIRQSNEFPKIN